MSEKNPINDNTKIFSVITVIIVAAIGWLFIINAALSSKVDTMSDTYVEIKSQLSQIQTDLGWLKNNTPNDRTK